MSKILKDYGNCFVATMPTKTQLKLLQKAVSCEIEVTEAIHCAPGYVIKRKGGDNNVGN